MGQPMQAKIVKGDDDIDIDPDDNDNIDDEDVVAEEEKIDYLNLYNKGNKELNDQSVQRSQQQMQKTNFKNTTNLDK